jgi:hypothetical protein
MLGRIVVLKHVTVLSDGSVAENQAHGVLEGRSERLSCEAFLTSFVFLPSLAFLSICDRQDRRGRETKSDSRTAREVQYFPVTDALMRAPDAGVCMALYAWVANRVPPSPPDIV